MMSCRGMGAVNPDKLPGAALKKGGKVESKVNEAGNYTKPGMRERMFNQIKGQATQGTKAGQWSLASPCTLPWLRMATSPQFVGHVGGRVCRCPKADPELASGPTR